MSVTEFLIFCLSCWRISNLLADDNEGGPWGVVHLLRAKAGVRYDDLGGMQGTNVVSSMMICPYCNSFWIGLTIGIAAMVIGVTTTAYLMLPLALSGATILISKYLTGES